MAQNANPKNDAKASHKHGLPDEPMTICDACAKEVPQAETQNGPEGSEWEGTNVCNDCYAENNP